jgi:phospholipid/cholesterol/gamma-HCH transport system ATP-binding protein
METKNNSTPIEVKHLSKSFGAQKVLNGIDLSVAHGETLAVVGRSGTGKSVLLKLLIGLQRPDAGSIRIHGKEITDLDASSSTRFEKPLDFCFSKRRYTTP